MAASSTLNQNGHPVAFHSHKFNKSEMNYSAVEKEAVAIMDDVHSGIICCYAISGLLFRQSLLAAVSCPSERVWFDDRVRRQKRTLHGCHQVRPGQLRDGSMCCVPPRRRFVSSVRFSGCT